MDADVVTILHVCPEANRDFAQSVTSPQLSQAYSGKGVLDIWHGLVPEDRFKSITVERLRDMIARNGGLDSATWADYLALRYSWDSQ